jgi:hypothetical protein
MRAKPDEIISHATYGIVAAMSGKNLERGERELKIFLADPPKEVTPQTPVDGGLQTGADL